MSNQTTLDGLIRSGETLKAIEQLSELIENLYSERLKDLNLLSSRFYSNKKVENDGLELRVLTETEKNKITYSFLNMLTDIKDEIDHKIGFYKPTSKSTNEKDILHDFLHSVLVKKYEDIKHFATGNTFLYFSAKELDSSMKVMIMVQRNAEINAIDKGDLNKIGQLKHRNLIQLLDANLKTFPNYIITEYVEGINLRDLLINIGSLPLHSAKRLLMLVGEVMMLLKQKRFPYASIRPSKIIIDQELEPEISPFDILTVHADKRLLKSFIEDCYYFAPEILYDVNVKISTNSIDKANQFCLAALGYEMVTGQKLFIGDNVAEILIERDKFFKEEVFRNEKFKSTRLTAKLVTIFKRMLQHNPLKRYDDLPTAMREIDKVRGGFIGDIEIIFNSYKRCLHDSEDFVVTFQKNLILQKNVGSIKGQLEKEVKEFEEDEKIQTETEKMETEEANNILYKKFYFDIHLVFDPENALDFLDKVTAHDTPDTSPVTEYRAFLDAFIKTVETCDPRYKTHRVVRKAWDKVSKELHNQLNKYTPLPEMPSTYVASAKSDRAISTDSAASSLSILTNIETSFVSMTATSENEDEDKDKNLDLIVTNDEVQYDPEKA
jgi:serine/threonine protein kinase